MARLKSPKQKGDRFERDIAEHLNAYLGISARRTPLSGGGCHSGDAMGDLLGTPFISIEAKAVERLNFHEAMDQAARNAGSDMPVVINRRNYQLICNSLVAMRFKDFITLYRALLLNKGIKCYPSESCVPGAD